MGMLFQLEQVLMHSVCSVVLLHHYYVIYICIAHVQMMILDLLS